MEELWVALRNTFRNQLRENFKRTNMVVTDTGNKLDFSKTEPGIGPIHTYFLPFETSYKGNYLVWKQVNNTYHASTTTLERLSDELMSKKIKQWDILLSPHFIDNQEGYDSLFPAGHRPFQSGSYEEKIAAVQVLGASIAETEALRPIKTDIIAFGVQMDTARGLQQGKSRQVKNLSASLKVECDSVYNALYSVQGQLMVKFNTNPKAAEAFFDVELLSSTSTEEDEPEEGLLLTLAPGQTLEAGIGITDKMVLSLTNHGEVPLNLWAGGDTPVPPQNLYTLAAGAEAEVSITDLGPAGSRYLYIMNANPDLAGAIEIIDVTPVAE